MSRLTPTSYAVLALLAERPYTGYELTRLIRAGFSQCMPRSTSGLYTEPKVLVEHGFATVTEEMKGRQKRKLYRITPAGRRALRKWFRTAPAPPVFESEAVVRLILGRMGRREDVIAALAQLESDVHELVERSSSEMPGWLEAVGATPEHLNDLALISRFYVDYYTLVVNWSRWAREQIAARPDRWPPNAAQKAMAELQRTIFGGELP